MLLIDLNSDLGESFGAYKIGRDEDILPLVSSANVACGFHAGDPTVMAKTVALCKKGETAVGAHPGFRDLEGFGRRNMAVSPADAKNLIIYQVGALQAFCKKEGIQMQHVKPHGALYNMAAKDAALAKAICEGIQEVDPSLILMGLAGSEMLRQAEAIGLPVARTKPGAMIHDEEEAVARVIRMICEHKVKTVTGKDIDIVPDSVCVHGDSEKALLFVKKIRAALEENGVTVTDLKTVLAAK